MDFSYLFESLHIAQHNPLLRRLVVVLVYALLAKGADLFIDRVLRRLAGYTRFRLDDALIAFLHTPLCLTILLLGVQHALVLEPVLPAPWLTVLPRAVRTMLLVLWVLALLRFANRAADLELLSSRFQDKIGRDVLLLIKNLARVLLLIGSLFALLAVWKIDMTPLFASAGIAGIAVAMAAKDTLANFFGGISIFADKTFKVGDYIILDTGERGEVVEIGIRSTRINTRDDVLVTVPNSILANTKIINESAPIPRFRIRVPVGVAYGTDLDQVERILLEVAAASPNVAQTPEPRVRLRLFADSSVNFELLCWVREPSLKGLETHLLLRAVYGAFQREGVVIPFPQRDVHLVAGERSAQA